jgi:hypothetical protein
MVFYWKPIFLTIRSILQAQLGKIAGLFVSQLCNCTAAMAATVPVVRESSGNSKMAVTIHWL